MKKITAGWIFLFVSFSLFSQDLKSPSDFLGYELGSRFTPHYQVVNYFQSVASSMPTQVKLQKYGETYEGRPLYLAFISSVENISNLENIRINNLRLTGLAEGNAGGKPLPIVWLSYNVHGNEASSSEASMQTIYELLKPERKEWLDKAVVIIDPCLNPDGRDRYVNWFTSVTGARPNARSFSREHDEPWPGGRTNHYNFDLNRDWAWQTQTETQARIRQYQQWMPQVHVDYHEQGYNEPYYFAPAAQPFHEVITPWQVELQTMIGKNNAQKFDAKGWLYFTKERFDLFYPSYGDTYPTYNGSVGMTYEQGGHSRGGLAVITDEGDTLTLKDRLWHHVTTGLSTVEVTVMNAEKVISQFKKYFDDAMNGIGSNYKSYILTSKDPGRMKAVKKVLSSNGIAWGNVFSITGLSGYNYFSGKTENVVAEKYSISVSALQPRSLLAKVLLEPSAKLSDSATYDITAWSLPYAYGVNAYALNTVVKASMKNSETPMSMADASYGLILPYTSVSDATLLARLLNNSIVVRVTQKDIVYNGISYPRGSLLVLDRDNKKSWYHIQDILHDEQASYSLLAGGFMESGPDMGSPDVLKLASPRVACMTGEGVNSNAAGEVWHLFEQQIHYPISMINSNRLRISSLRDVDVLIMPEGYYEFIKDKKTNDELKAWVQNGGRIIALENAVSQLATAEWGVKIKKEEEKKEDKNAEINTELRRYGNRDRDDLVNSIPGAIYKVEMDETHPLAFGIGKTFYSLKQNPDVMEFMKDGWNVGTVKKMNKVTGFAGNVVTNKIKDGTLFGVQDMGRGKVIYLLDNPIFRNFWENGKLLFLNAVFMVGNEPMRL